MFNLHIKILNKVRLLEDNKKEPQVFETLLIRGNSREAKLIIKSRTHGIVHVSLTPPSL
jgi:hypothetical protein